MASRAGASYRRALRRHNPSLSTARTRRADKHIARASRMAGKLIAPEAGRCRFRHVARKWRALPAWRKGGGEKKSALSSPRVNWQFYTLSRGGRQYARTG